MPEQGRIGEEGRQATEPYRRPLHYRVVSQKGILHMAQQKRIELIDDLDGSTADETISFGLDGASYQIDLSQINAAELRQSMTEFVDHAKRLGRDKAATKGTRQKSTPQSSQTAREERARTQAIRTWARAAGYDVSARGRIPDNIIEAYNRAH